MGPVTHLKTMRCVDMMEVIVALAKIPVAFIASERAVFAMRLANPFARVWKLCPSYSFFPYFLFQGTCSWGGDGVCHGYTNHEECNFDDGDCCLESVTQCLYCFHNEECICDKTGTMHCTEVGINIRFS